MSEPVLRNCLVEEEGAALRSRGRRAESWLASLALQAGVVAALVLLPLAATGELPLVRYEPPVYVQHGVPHARPQQPGTAQKPRPSNKLQAWDPTKHYPPEIPREVVLVAEDAPPSDISGSGPGDPNLPPGDLLSPFPPGLFEPGRVPLPAPPKPKEQARARIPVGGDLQKAKLVHRVEPVYPVLMKQIGRQGAVVLHAIIATDGTVRALEARNGEAAFVGAAMEAVAQWRYRPTLLNGVPVEVETTITVIFTLRR